jgi:hypothetical protein
MTKFEITIAAHQKIVAKYFNKDKLIFVNLQNKTTK